MCRNIRTLHHFQPPTTPEEIRAASLQYVRKVSGLVRPPRDAKAVKAYERAIDQVVKVTSQLLEALPAIGEPRTREREKERARERWARREQTIKAGA